MEINAAVFRKVHEPLTIEAVPSLCNRATTKSGLEDIINTNTLWATHPAI